ncbi:NADPH-dependent FMN reductase [Actinomycetospora lemnae]|uniref:NAD(P)H-dependent oxidoreductase n=1 Tax=Actinomycetospora lemnae TaxID=3019891 RepID=A0ABT5T0H5_9PSEU|nr:NAD(P)H-dependent oxidoreductase [Actinomycetospora sp. DW7H6]MDD7968481.1 NAD(P)H-dependent oxidoreductase [Actinomycetospora sp. DW7H6]
MTETDQAIPLAVVIGSVREGRFGPVVAQWFAERARRRPAFSVDVVDLLETGLDTGFAERIDAADAVVIVTPEYNHSFPGPLKTAIDATGGEWRAKPVGFVAYGGLSGGLRAVEQLRPVLAELHAVGLRDTVSFHGAAGAFDAAGRPREDAADAAATVLLDALAWWAPTLRRARDEQAAGV